MKKHNIIISFLVTALLASCASRPVPKPISLADMLERQEFAAEEAEVWQWQDAEPMGEYYREQVRSRMPAEETLTPLDRYQSSDWLKQFDFSGVSIERRTCTAVHPRLVVFAYHYMPAAGSKINFVDRNGDLVERTVLARRYINREDRAIGVLDKALPATVKVYRVFPAPYKWHLLMAGAWILATDQTQKAHVYVVTGGYSNHNTYNGAPYTGHLLTYARSTLNFPSPPSVASEPLITGDSSNPSFVVYNGELVLLTHHWTPSSGPMVTQSEWYLAAARDLLNSYPEQ